MQLKIRLLVILIPVILSGCTDSRMKSGADLMSGAPGRSGNSVLIPRVTIHFDQAQTMAYKMLVVGSTLYLTGKPFGLSVWDIGTNPLAPHLLFAYSDNINNFSNMPGWAPDYYASGGIAALGNLLLTSGMAGASLINAANLQGPVELGRFPGRALSDLQVPQDPNFTYNAVIADPNQPYFYGFREQDFAASLQLSGNAVNLVQTLPYSSNGNKGTCCVTGGAVFQGSAYIGFRSSVRKFNFAGNGQLTEAGIMNQLNGTNIISTSQYLFVQHQAVPGNSFPSGIYVFNGQMQTVAFLPILPIAFAVSSDNNYLYANMDNDSIQVFENNWGQNGYNSQSYAH